MNHSKNISHQPSILPVDKGCTIQMGIFTHLDFLTLLPFTKLLLLLEKFKVNNDYKSSWLFPTYQ